MSKGVIFDFDGVMAETEPFQLEAYNRLLTQFGAPQLTDLTFIREYIGLFEPGPFLIDRFTFLADEVVMADNRTVRLGLANFPVSELLGSVVVKIASE
jgi:beta-phosphoglucomutase-like phosphatase (HAD superfamily)